MGKTIKEENNNNNNNNSFFKLKSNIKRWTAIEQAMLRIVTIAVREIIYVCIDNQNKMQNIDFQQGYVLKKN